MLFSSVQLLSHVQLFATPWIAARQASLSIIISRSSLRFMFIESVVPSSFLILCHPLLLPPSIYPGIRVFSNESVLCIRWPKYWTSAPVLPMNIQDWPPCSPRDSQESSLTAQFKSISSSALSLLCGPVFISIHDYWKSHQFSSVQSLSHVWLCDPVNHSTPGLPVHHHLPEFTQTHVHRVCDAIQPSHPWSSPSLPALNPSQHQSLF